MPEWCVLASHVEVYKRAVAADPIHAVNLGNYALFLKNRRLDSKAAERHYQRAIEADPKNAFCLGGYAVLVFDIHHDADRAETLFKKALAADSRDAFSRSSPLSQPTSPTSRS